MGRMQRLALRNARILALVARFDVLNRLKLHAQALTYDTLLALVPFLVVIFALIRGFGGLRDLGTTLEDFALQQLSGTAEINDVLGQHLRQFIANMRGGNIGGISILILVFSVMSLLGHIEFAFNAIYEAKTKRSWVTRLLTYWAVLTLGPILLAASFALTAALQTSSVAAVVQDYGWFKRLGVTSLPLLSTWLGLTIMYLVVPHTRVKPSAALGAAVIAGSLWNVAKYGYAFYAKHALTLQNIYGSAAAVPLFILWLYVSWLLVLFGAQLAFAWQHATIYADAHNDDVANQASKELGACRLMLAVASDFLGGAPGCNVDTLGQRLGLPRHIVLHLVHLLEEGGFVRAAEDDGGLLPATDLGRINIDDIISHLRRRPGHDIHAIHDDTAAHLKALFADLRRCQSELARPVDFRSLAASALAAGAAGTSTRPHPEVNGDDRGGLPR